MSKKVTDKSQVHVEYKKDEFGQDVLLKDNHQVMMGWEKPHQESCINTLKPSGDILEIGFCLGYSSNQIQQFHPKSHTIIESEPVIAQKAKEWAKNHPNVTIIEGEWRNQLEKLGTFDIIFFNESSFLTKDEIDHIEEDVDKLKKLRLEVQVITNNLNEMLNNLKDIKFTDEQLDEFIDHIKKRTGKLTKEAITDFIMNLVDKGHISVQQEIKFLDKLELIYSEKEEATQSEQADNPNSQRSKDHLQQFIQLCIEHHMKKNSRLAAFVDILKFHNHHHALQQILSTHPDITYTQKILSIKVPENCHYYVGNQACFLIINKS